MFESILQVIAALVCACFFFDGSFKLLGVMQQSGYRGKGFCKWLVKKENTYYLRVFVWSMLLLFGCASVTFCFAFLGEKVALCLSAIPFFGLSLLFGIVDKKHALKVPVTMTGRVKRLAVVHFFLTACVTYLLIALCGFFTKLIAANGEVGLYAYAQYLPVALMPILLPWIFFVANAITYPFEEARNKRFIQKSTQKLAEKSIVKVGIVGSYGKTSVKQILTTLLSQKYAVCATPASFNTPMGIAKTVSGEGFDGAEVFVAEMGARRRGDIAVLCDMVAPDYALFTGVCAQHIETFGSLDAVKEEKCSIFKSGAKKVVCAPSLKEDVKAQYEALRTEERAKIAFLTGEEIKDLKLCFNATKFNLVLGAEEFVVDTKLLGAHAAENIALCAALALEMGLSREQLQKGLDALEPVGHRLELLEENGVYILDDAYNANERGAAAAIDALSRFEGKKIVVTPGLVETGVLQRELGEKLGEKLAQANLDKVILVGGTQVAPIQLGYKKAGGEEEKLTVCFTLEEAKSVLATLIQKGDAVLFLNDLPDVY